MRVCLVCVEMFGRGTYGGFGRATRIIGRELITRGVEVTTIVPQRAGFHERDYIFEGVRILEFPRRQPWTSLDLFRQVDADIYHSQDSSLSTYLAWRAMPDRAHVITFRDPMSWDDWRIEWRYANSRTLPWFQYPLYVDNFLVNRAVRRARALYCAAKFLIPKVRTKYQLPFDPVFLPTPVHVPDKVVKATQPTVCHVGRWHPRKRPELFLELAKHFPCVKFIAVGNTEDRARDELLRRTYGHLPNLEMTGVINQFETDRLAKIYEQSWVLVNTAAREGLPNVFLEATAQRCAILSPVDPDGFASRFGYHAQDGDLRKGLAFLLEQDRWKERGEQACAYIRDTFATDRAIDLHLQAYDQALRR